MNNQINHLSNKEFDKYLIIQQKILETFKSSKIIMPLRRFEGSKFLIGTKIVDFKIANNKINIRVGGGYNKLE